MFEVYSPALVTSQESILINLRAVEAAAKFGPDLRKGAVENLDLTRQRLRFWDVNEEQINQLEKSHAVLKTLIFRSPFTGIAIQKRAFEGKFVPAGQLLYRIADLSKVWVYAYVYQDQIDCVYEGQSANMTVPDLPGHRFHGKVIFIYPYLEPKVRAVRVRLEFDNPDLFLKPDMFTRMEFEPHHMGLGLNIPREAVLDTGLRHLVYVTLPGDQFEAREVKTGRELDGNRVEILTGLHEDEQIVTSGSYMLDSESRLRSINRKFEPLPPSPMSLPMKSPMKKEDMKMKDMKHEGHEQPSHPK